MRNEELKERFARLEYGVMWVVKPQFKSVGVSRHHNS